jgi:hypothetical protein
MSSRRPTRLFLRATRTKVSATLIEDMSKEEVIDVHRIWHPVRHQGLQRLRSQGKQEPENAHWDWNDKAGDLDLLAYRCVGIECEDKVQGLMMMSTLYPSSRVPSQHGKLAVYVEYLEKIVARFQSEA